VDPGTVSGGGAQRILMVTPYPPLRDGIAAYAVQAVARLRAEGHHVEVLSPGPSAAHHHLELSHRRGPLALARRIRHYDRVVVQYYPGLFHASDFGDWRWAMTNAALAAAFRAGDVEVRVHETDPSRAVASRLVAASEQLLWHAAGRVVVHTEAERQAFHRDHRFPLDRIEVAAHGVDFVRRTTMDRAEARARLGIPTGTVMFLAIGFIQPHKGFDRAVRAFAGLGDDGCRLDVVGSVRVEDPAYVGHLEELRRLVSATPGATLHERFVTDEEFDQWVVASDVVVLPYRQIWSSSVMERAALYGRPVVASRVGGLPDQARPDTILVASDGELAEAMRQAAGLTEDRRVAWPAGPVVDRHAVMAEIRTRAAAGRSGDDDQGDMGAYRALNPLDAVPVLTPAPPASRRPGAARLKRVIRRLTGWQIDPVVEHVNAVRQAGAAGLRSLAQRIESTDGAVAALERDLAEARDQTSGLARRVSAQGATVDLLVAEARARLHDDAGSASTALAACLEQRLSPLYAQFEQAFRGSREEIIERQAVYLDDVLPLATTGVPIVDIGPGRGEWLELLRRHGIPAYGIDVNQSFGELGRERGLDVRTGDGLRHLQGLDEASVAGVTAFHIVEHVDLDTTVDLVDAALRALVPGGVLIVETPNPTNLSVGAASFYVDPTHRRPVHPHFLKFLLAARGFDDPQIRYLHPADDRTFDLPKVDGDDDGALERMVAELNTLFFGPQDYAVVARKPADTALPPRSD
jgi:glycosyltransferase involved in cell wall biosynthesis/SAM-dependent methyltransferase